MDYKVENTQELKWLTEPLLQFKIMVFVDKEKLVKIFAQKGSSSTSLKWVTKLEPCSFDNYVPVNGEYDFKKPELKTSSSFQ